MVARKKPFTAVRIRLRIYVLLLSSHDKFWDDENINIGYARVSPGEQTLDLHLDALNKDGCERVFTETAGRRFPLDH